MPEAPDEGTGNYSSGSDGSLCATVHCALSPVQLRCPQTENFSWTNVLHQNLKHPVQTLRLWYSPSTATMFENIPLSGLA